MRAIQVAAGRPTRARPISVRYRRLNNVDVSEGGGRFGEYGKQQEYRRTIENMHSSRIVFLVPVNGNNCPRIKKRLNCSESMGIRSVDHPAKMFEKRVMVQLHSRNMG